MTPKWAQEAQRRIHDLISELAAEGKLSQTGAKGMVQVGTVVVEFIGEDGDDWHFIGGFPHERWRDLAVHAKLLNRAVDMAVDMDDELQ